MIIKEKSWLTYLFSSNPQICLWYHRLGHTNNVKIIQTSKLIDKIDLGGEVNSKNQFHSSNSKFEEEDNKKLNTNTENKFVLIYKLNKNSDNIKQLYKIYIEGKYIRIVKLKSMTPITRKLQEIYINL